MLLAHHLSAHEQSLLPVYTYTSQHSSWLHLKVMSHIVTDRGSEPITLAKRSDPDSPNWPRSSQWMWLITGQLATGTCAKAGCKCELLKWESVALCILVLSNCFNDFPTLCFIFISPLLSVYCKGLPASENDQLCIPLNMYISAFVYSIAVH